MLFSESLVHAYICFFLFGLGNGMLGPGISSSLSLSVGKDYQGAAGGFFRHGDTHWAYCFPLISMPLYTLNPSYPYLMGSSVMLMALVFIFQVSAING